MNTTLKLGNVTTAVLAALALCVWTAGCGPSEPESVEAPDTPAVESPAAPAEAGPTTGPVSETPAALVESETADGMTAISAGDGGALMVRIPEGSERTARNEGAGGILSEQWETPDGVIIQVNLLGPVGKLRDFGSDAWLRDEMDTWIRGKEGSLVDGPREVVPLSTDTVEGVYIKVASDNPSPTAYHYAINGFFRVGDQVVSMGGLHNDDDGNADEAILEAIESATWKGGGETGSAAE